MLTTKIKIMAEIKTLDEFKEYAQRHLRSLKPCEKPDGWYTIEVRVVSYFDAICIAPNLIKAYLVVIDPDAAEVSNALPNNSINPCDLLELALQIMPFSEFEMLYEIHKMVNSKNDG
jgi:hypothetical protein